MSRQSELRNLLATVPLFAACSRGDLALVARHMQVVSLAGGTVLMKQGDHGDAFYVVLDGTATVGVDGREVATVAAGEHVGELALLDPAPRSATVTAASDLVVGVLDARTFAAIIRDVPALTGKLLAALARRLRERDREAATR